MADHRPVPGLKKKKGGITFRGSFRSSTYHCLSVLCQHNSRVEIGKSMRNLICSEDGVQVRMGLNLVTMTCVQRAIMLRRS